MKKFRVLIIGHSIYPEGAKSFTSFFGVPKEGIDTLNINNEKTIETLAIDFKEYIATHENVIVIADLTGGSPHKTAMEILSQSKHAENKYIISGISMGATMEIALKATITGIDDIVGDINLAIKESTKNIMIYGKGVEFKQKEDKKVHRGRNNRRNLEKGGFHELYDFVLMFFLD